MKLLSIRSLALAAIFSVAASHAFAGDKADDEAMKARSIKGVTTIRCSPYGKVEGTVGFDEAVKKAKRGTVVQLLPGFYNPMELPIFDDDGVIIEGDGSGGYVDVPLILYGRDIVIRNIKVRSIEAEDAIIVDTISNHITLTTSNRTSKPVVYNCCMNGTTIYANMQEVVYKYCTIVNGKDVDDSTVGQSDGRLSYSGGSNYYYSVIDIGQMVKKGKLEFENCVINSNADLFNKGDKMLELTMKDNLIYFTHSLTGVQKDKSPVKIEGGEEAFMTKGSLAKANVFGRPLFKNPAEKWGWGWRLDRESFILTPQSPAGDKGWGANMGDNGVPTPQPVKK